MNDPGVAMPGCNAAWIPRRKLEAYLLATTHPVGGSKAALFLRLGYGLDNVGTFEDALLHIARTGVVSASEIVDQGRKYVVDGLLKTSTAKEVRLRTIWIVEPPDVRPRLVTAYPL